MQHSLPEGPPWIELRLPNHRIQSLNRILNMNPWQRDKLKHGDQDAVLSALRAAERSSSTHGQTFTADPSTLRTLSSTLEHFQMTRKQRRKESSRKRRLEKVKLRKQSSASGGSHE